MAYYRAKKGILDFQRFLAEVKQLRQISKIDDGDLDVLRRAYDEGVDKVGSSNKLKSNWPWKKSTLSIKELIKDGGRCKEWAVEIQKSIGGDIIKITPDYSRFPGAKKIGPVYTRNKELISNLFEEHYVVKKGNIYYDRITGPSGLKLIEYKKLFEWSDDLNFGK